MNILKSIKLLSAFALMSTVWGCSSSKQVANSSSAGVYDDLYASASQTRPANLVTRESLYAAENEEEYARNPEYRTNNNTNQGTDEYYSKNWLNSRTYYQNQTNSNYYNNNSSYYNNNYGLYNWYNNPSISFGLGYGYWSPYGYNSLATPYWNDPWGWGSSRWAYGSSFGLGWSSFGWNSFGYSPWGYNAYAYNPYYYDPWVYNYNSYYGRGNTYIYNNYGSIVTGANSNYSNNGGYSAPVKRTREPYSQSAYNGSFDNRNSYNNGQRGARSSSDYYSNGNSSSNNTYYSRPQRASGYSNNNSSSSYNSTTNTNRSNNSSWNWSNNNSSSNSSNRTSTSSWGGSSGGSSSGGGGGGSSSGGSRGPR